MYISIHLNPNGCFELRDGNGHWHLYYYYSKREALRLFREQYGLKYKRVDIYDYTNAE